MEKRAETKTEAIMSQVNKYVAMQQRITNPHKNMRDFDEF